MRVFVSEYLCSGAWPEPDLPVTLAREGRAMLLALLADLARLPDVSLCSTWDARLGIFPVQEVWPPHEPRGLSPWPHTPGESDSPIACTLIHTPADERAAFNRLAAESDAAYIIAPELHDLLTRRRRQVVGADGRSLNSSADAIAVCSDKWETFQRLSRAGAPTIPTERFDPDSDLPRSGFPLVLKPRFGAGSTNTFLIRNRNQLRAAAAHFASDSPATEAIVQPYVAGAAISVAAIYHTDGTLRELWPVVDQRIGDDGRFTFLGGTLPATFACDSLDSILKSQISTLIPDLCGYVGFDMLLPHVGHAGPLIVDINPRLTTSYLGYRALSTMNLAGRILWPDRDWPPLSWRDSDVGFTSEGQLLRSPLHS